MYPDLERLFEQLREITPLRAHPHPVYPGSENSVFQLEKDGERYFLLPCPLFAKPGCMIPQLLSGKFTYAILADYPQQVMVGPELGNTNYEGWQRVRDTIPLLWPVMCFTPAS